MNPLWTHATLSEVCHLKPAKAEARQRVPLTSSVSFLPMEDLGVDQKFVTPTQSRVLQQVVGSYTYFADGDVLLAKITPCFENGKLGIAKELLNGAGFGSSEYFVLRPKPHVAADWLYYFLSREQFRQEGAQRMSGAVGHKRVEKEFLENQSLPIPSIQEQRRIVRILDEAFAAIAKAKANTERNLQNAHALFRTHLQAVFGGVYQSWTEKTLGEVCKFIGGSQPPKSRFLKKEAGDTVRLIQIRDYKSDNHRVFIPRSSARRFCTKEDIMIGRYGPPIFQILRGLEGAYNVALMKAVPDCRSLMPDYLFYFLKHDKIQSYVVRSSERAAGQSGLNKETLEPYPIAFPSLEDQARIVERIGEIEQACVIAESVYRRKAAALDALKQSLLHQAFAANL